MRSLIASGICLFSLMFDGSAEVLHGAEPSSIATSGTVPGRPSMRSARAAAAGTGQTDMETAVPRRPGQTRHIVIIARPYAALFEYVRGRFAGEDIVEVVLDRRTRSDRRRRTVRASPERRLRERRRRPHIDDALRVESMQIVSIC
jgi:hypothetical protein